MKKILALLTLSLFILGATAQPSNITRGYGLDKLVEISPASPFWGIDKAIDNSFVDKGKIAHERASEAYKMSEKNNTEAAQRAIQDMNRVAEQATNKSTKGLQKAQRVLEQVRKRTPTAANLGIDHAIENVKRAQQRGPGGKPGRPNITPGEGEPGNETPGQKPEEPGEVTQGKEDNETEIPVYPGASETSISDQMKGGLGITSEMELEGYKLNESPETIISWYKNNIGDWNLINETTNSPPDGSLTIYINNYRRDDEGASIFTSKNPEGNGTIFGIATGSWEAIQGIGQAEEEEEEEEPGEMPEEEEMEEGERVFPDYKYLDLPEEKVKFDRAPLDTEDIKSVWPVGTYMSDESETGHIFPATAGYLEWKNPEEYPPSIPVRAPADGYVVIVNKRSLEWPSGSGHSGTYTDYRIRMAFSKTQFTEMGHISELSEDLKNRTGTLEEGETRMELEVSKGDLLGYTGGRPGAQYTMNWRVMDSDVRNFVNPEAHGIRGLESHFLNYSTDSLKSKLEPLSLRQDEPITGRFDFDEKGKLSGNWFHEEANSSYDYEHLLSFCYDPYDLSSPRVNMGGTIATKGVYSIAEGPDPKTVGMEDGKVTYHLETASDWGGSSLPDKTLLVELVNETRVKIQSFDGWEEGVDFTDPQIYARSLKGTEEELNKSEAVENETEISIKENALSSKQLDVPHVYDDDDGGFCYIGSLATLTNYYNNSTEISEVISYSGLATRFQLGQPGAEGEEEEEEEELTVTMIWPMDISQTAENLGYSPYVDYAGEPSRALKGFLEKVPSDNQKQFSGEAEAFERLKQLITSGIPVLVRIDYHVLDSSLPTGTVHYVVVTGYDEDNIYVNDPSSNQAPKEDIPISESDFLEVWGKEFERPSFGPYFMFYLSEAGSKKSTSEILTTLKNNAKDAPANLRSYADKIDDGQLSEQEVTSSLKLPHPSTIRGNLAIFLEEQGLEEVAAKYQKSTDKFEEAEGSSDLSEISGYLREIADLEEEAYGMWE